MTSSMERDSMSGSGANGVSGQGQQLQSAATGLIDQATRTAEAQASTTMTRAGETLQTFADAIRDAGTGMQEQQPAVAGMVDTAAERVQEAATYLRDHGAREALDNAQRIARSQPALVIGGALVAGIVLGRVLRSGASAVQPQNDQAKGYGTAGYGGTDTYAVADAYGDAYVGETAYVGDQLAATDVAVDATLDDDMLDDSATGDGLRDEAPTAGRSTR